VMEQYQSNGSSKGISIAALVCGIVGIVGAWFPVICYFALIIAIVGIVLGAIGMKKAKENNEPTGLATAGLVLGIIGTALAVIGVICIVACTVAANAAGSQYLDQLNDLANQLGNN
ncbi:MAG: DUF4190 domain-containing protein, partial [Clostridia bacterium]|nr:DUF4190 domain-containing protein [Clostridia bacterium]